MILNYIKLTFAAASIALISACSSSGSSSSDDGTEVTLSAAPSPAIAAAMPAGLSKTFMNDLGDTIVITKAYLVIASATIETECGASFSAAAEGLLNILIPQANAHTSATPTSTGEPVVINLLAVDGGAIELGELSPPTGDYCGVDIDMLAADDDAANLPSGAGEPDMVGKTIHIEGSYTLRATAGGGNGTISLSTGTTLINRELLLSALMIISKDEPKGSVAIGINYDTWFDAVALDVFETETSTLDTNTTQVLLNISNSIHQI